MKHYIEISNPIFPFTFHVLLNYKTIPEIKKRVTSECEQHTKKIHKRLDKLKWDESQGYSDECKGWIFILIKDFNGTPKCYDTLHHEIVHAVDFSAKFIGIKHHKSSREYFAYMTGFLTNQIYQKLKP